MTLTIKLSIFIALFGLIGCEKQGDNPGVEEYISQLKSNSYEAYELPAFKPADIPALLKYRNSTMVISNFPRNGISSLYAPDCKLGMYVLWTMTK